MKDKFLEIFKEALEAEDKEINMSDEFRDYDEWDSLAQLSLIAALDEEFEVEIEDEEFQTLKTIEELFNAVSSKSNS
ncbi:MAG: acyl carrier protein [Balneolales bacterium]|nr:acyl carrier protein [Balneolales bacterium]